MQQGGIQQIKRSPVLECMNFIELIPLTSLLAKLGPETEFEMCRVRESHIRRGEKNQKQHFFSITSYILLPHLIRIHDHTWYNLQEVS